MLSLWKKSRKVNLPHPLLKAGEEMETKLQSFFSSALDGVKV
jgi:hypothetical protein